MNVNSHSSHWPVQYNPSHQDVTSAAELPNPSLLLDFKKALMSSEDSARCEKLLHVDFKTWHPAPGFTYPLALLGNFPPLPSDDRMTQLARIFLERSSKHIFFDHLPRFESSREAVHPPLRLGMACLASIIERGPVEEPYNLFSAGANLWAVMVEMDNTLARSVEMLLAAVLLIPYGVLADTKSHRRMTSLVLCSALTIARRLRLHDHSHLRPEFIQRVGSHGEISFIWLLWLWDVLFALHSGASLNFASHEVLSFMPSTTISFQDVYQDLLHEPVEHKQSLLSIINSYSREQAVLLLLAILSDSITIRRSLGQAINSDNPAQMAASKHNPFVPFSTETELLRVQSQLLIALDRWRSKFEDTMSPDIIALYHYCKLYLACPVISILPKLAQYSPSFQSEILFPRHHSNDIIISAESVRHAWALLDMAAMCSKSDDAICSAWMPIVVFHASMVVWADISLSESAERERNPSTRALIAFKVELQGCLGLVVK